MQSAWKRWRHFGTLLVIILAMLALAACGGATEVADDSGTSTPAPSSDTPAPADDPQPSARNEIIHAARGDSFNLNPLTWKAGYNWQQYYHIYDSLFAYDKDLNIQGQLVESWDIEDDGRTYVLHLRKGVTFHDGAPMTAEDVAFTFYAHLRPDTESVMRGLLQMLVGWEELTDADNPADPDDLDVKPVEVVDDHTVIVRIKEPFAAFPTVIAAPKFAIAPKHIMETEADLNQSVMNTAPIGTGPWHLVEWVRDERQVYEAHDNYHDGRPILDRLIYRPIPEASTRIAELELGNADFTVYPPGDMWTRIMEHPDLEALHGPDLLTYRSFMLQANAPFLDEKPVRQALAHALDQEEFIIQGYGSLEFGAVATGPLGPGDWSYTTEGITTYDYDPDRAIQLLEEAGFVRNGDGYFERDGQVMEYDAIASSGLFVEHSALAQERFRAVGVKLNVLQMEASEVSERLRSGDFGMYFISGSGEPDPHHNMFRRYYSKGGENYHNFADERIDSLLEQGAAITAKEDRIPIYQEFQRIATEEAWYLIAYHPHRFYAQQKSLKGMEFSPITVWPVVSYRWAYFED